MKLEFQFPIKGKNTNAPMERQPLLTTPEMENMRPDDQDEHRVRGGKRPAARRWSTSRIGGGDYRIDKFATISRSTLLADTEPYWPPIDSEEYGSDPYSVWKLIEEGVNLFYVWGYNTTTLSDYARCIYVDSSGNVYACGTSGYQAGAWHNVWKLNSSGAALWYFKTWDTLHKDNYYLAVDSSGNVYIVGARTDRNETLWKVNNSGVEQWAYDCGGIEAGGVCIDGNGDIVVSTRVGTDQDGDEGSLRKFDSSGNRLWVQNLNLERGQVKVDGSNNIFTCVWIGAPTNDYHIWKGDTDGVELWKAGLGKVARSIYVDAADNVYVGSEYGTDEDSDAGNIRKYNSSGTKQWVQNYGGTINDICAGPTGTLYLAGGTSGNVRKINSSDGSLVYVKTLANYCESMGVYWDGTNLYYATNSRALGA